MGLTKKLQLIGNIEVDDAVINELVPDAGQHLAISAVTGKDIKINLSDADGARKLLIYDSDNALVASIDSNGVITGTSLVGPLTGNSAGTHTGNVAATSASHLSVTNAAADKNIVFKLGDAAGATKISFTDSADAEVASIDSNGVVDGSKITAPLTYAEAETTGAPTNAECVSAFGAAATVGAGFVGVLQDTAANGVSYLCVSNGTNYDVFTGVAGA